MPNIELPDSHFRDLFDLAPEPYLVVLPDERFTIVFANQARLQVTMTEPNQVLGRGIFEVFPDNPNDAEATGVRNLTDSLRYVAETRTAHTMPVQRYDIKKPGGDYEERYWTPVNVPVISSKGELLYIIHRVKDVTEIVQLDKSGKKERHRNQFLQTEKKRASRSALEAL